MAIGVTFRSATHVTTNTTSYTTSTGAFTPTAGNLMLAWVISRGGTDAPTSVSGNGVTYSEIDSLTGSPGGTGTYLGLWAGQVGGSPSSGEVVASGWGSNRTGCSVMVSEISGADLSGGVAAAFVQTPDTGGGLSGTSASITLAAAGHTDNRAFSAWIHHANEATDFRTDWAELSDGNYASPNTGAECQWRSDAFETTASASWGSSVGYLGMACEVKALVSSAEPSGWFVEHFVPTIRRLLSDRQSFAGVLHVDTAVASTDGWAAFTSNQRAKLRRGLFAQSFAGILNADDGWTTFSQAQRDQLHRVLLAQSFAGVLHVDTAVASTDGWAAFIDRPIIVRSRGHGAQSFVLPLFQVPTDTAIGGESSEYGLIVNRALPYQSLFMPIHERSGDMHWFFQQPFPEFRHDRYLLHFNQPTITTPAPVVDNQDWFRQPDLPLFLQPRPVGGAVSDLNPIVVVDGMEWFVQQLGPLQTLIRPAGGAIIDLDVTPFQDDLSWLPRYPDIAFVKRLLEAQRQFMASGGFATEARLPFIVCIVDSTASFTRPNRDATLITGMELPTGIITGINRSKTC